MSSISSIGSIRQIIFKQLKITMLLTVLYWCIVLIIYQQRINLQGVFENITMTSNMFR